jgi:hypothetical protein
MRGAPFGVVAGNDTELGPVKRAIAGNDTYATPDPAPTPSSVTRRASHGAGSACLAGRKWLNGVVSKTIVTDRRTHQAEARRAESRAGPGDHR